MRNPRIRPIPVILLAGCFTMIDGQNTGDQLGFAVARYADANGDSFGDFVVSAPRFDVGANADAGKVYVFAGASDVLTNNPALGSAWFTASGVGAGERAGWSLVTGDFNGDGLIELSVGAPRRSVSGKMVGVVYVVNGADVAAGGSFDLANADCLLLGANDADDFGWALAAGDQDGDGYTDLAVGAPGVSGNYGAAYVFRGGVDFLSSCNQTPDVTLAETTGVARLGFSVLLTDIGGDGLADLVAGGPSWKSSRGVVRVDATDGSLGPWAGDAAGDKAGWSLSTIELDGAAGDELLIGAPFASAVDASGLPLSHVGRAYALEAWAVSGLLGAVAMGGVYGEAQNDMLGYALSATGNLASVYGASLIVGAPGGDRNGLTDNGVGYIFDGSTIVGNGASGVSAADGGAIAASTSKARLGAALAGLGDVNGVVYDDAIAGAPGANGVGEVVLGGQ